MPVKQILKAQGSNGLITAATDSKVNDITIILTY